MKKALFLISLVMMVAGLSAQSYYQLNVNKSGQATYQSSVNDINTISFGDGTATINGTAPVTYDFADIDSITFSTVEIATGDTVFVTYNGSSATIINPHANDGVSVTTSGANVSVSSVAENIIYCLSGTSTNGSIAFTSMTSFTLVLRNLNLTSGATPAIGINSVVNVTMPLIGTSTIADGSGIQDAAFWTDGSITTSGTGTLAVTGNRKHAFDIEGSLTHSSGTLKVNSAQSDAFHIDGDFFTSGNSVIQIAQTAADGFDITGNVNIQGGSITINAPGIAGRGLRTKGILNMSSGTLDITATGDTTRAIKTTGKANITGGNITLDIQGYGAHGISSDTEVAISGTPIINITSASVDGKCIKSDSLVNISGGNITIVSTAADGKGIKADNNLSISGGTINATMSGNGANGISSDTDITISGNANITVNSTSLDGKGISSNGTLNINNGTVNVTHSGNQSKGIKSDGILTISGGNITVNANGTYVLASGDMSYCTGIKGDNNINISGGTIHVTCSSSNNGGKCISSDMNVNVSGGTLTLSALGGSGSYTATTGTSSYTTVGIKSNLATTISGGDITMNVGGKGVSCDGNFTMSGGETKIFTSGNGAVISGSGTSATDGYCSAGVSADGNFTATAGKLYCKSTGKGGRGIKVDGTMTVGTLNADDNLIWIYVTTSGAAVNVSGGGGPGPGGSSSDYWKGLPKGIKVTGNLTINSGHVSSYCSQTSGDPTGEAIESKASIFIKGGEVEANSYDDAINCQTSLEVSGGKVWAYARGNDGIDCNGSSTKFSGGYVVAAGTEEAIDANCDGMGGVQGHLYICGSTILVFRAGSGGGMGMSLLDSPTFQNNQKRVTMTSNFTANNSYCLKNSSSTPVMIYKHPNVSGDGMQNNWYTGKDGGDDENGTGTKPPGNNYPIFTSPQVTTGTYSFFTSCTINGGTSWHGLYIGGSCTTSGSGTNISAGT